MKFKPLYIALLLPLIFTMHFLEEFMFGFPDWFRYLFSGNLDYNNFLMINVPALLIVLINTFFYLINKGSIYFTALIGTLMGINGIAHVTASFITTSYSPGVATGILFYLPIGYLTYKILFPLIAEGKRKGIVILAALVQVGIILIALSF